MLENHPASLARIDRQPVRFLCRFSSEFYDKPPLVQAWPGHPRLNNMTIGRRRGGWPGPSPAKEMRYGFSAFGQCDVAMGAITREPSRKTRSAKLPTSDAFDYCARKNATFALHAAGAVMSGSMMTLQPSREALLLICCRCSEVSFMGQSVIVSRGWPCG